MVTDDDAFAERIECAIDPCRFYWDGRKESFAGYLANGARASEIEGAIMNCQLDRIDDMIATMRAQKRRILTETAACGLTPSPGNSPAWECGTHVAFLLPTAAAANALAERTGGWVALKTGRHVYTEWDPVLEHRGAHHAAVNPFALEQNRGCRMDYSKEDVPAVAGHPRQDRVPDNPSRFLGRRSGANHRAHHRCRSRTHT